MKVGILGSGMVGETLSNGFLKHGHEVMRGSRDPKKLATWRAGAGDRAQVGTFEETAKFAELAVLGVKGTAAEEAIALCKGALDGKTVLDTTNPIAEAPPVNGVLQYFTGQNESLLERLQRVFPAVHFVKAFSSVGSAAMVNPDYGGIRPSMFICGNDTGAKKARENPRSVRLGHRRHGGGRGRAAHRGVVYALVHSRVSQQPVDARLRVVKNRGSGVMGMTARRTRLIGPSRCAEWRVGSLARAARPIRLRRTARQGAAAPAGPAPREPGRSPLVRPGQARTRAPRERVARVAGWTASGRCVSLGRSGGDGGAGRGSGRLEPSGWSWLGRGRWRRSGKRAAAEAAAPLMLRRQRAMRARGVREALVEER